MAVDAPLPTAPSVSSTALTDALTDTMTDTTTDELSPPPPPRHTQSRRMSQRDFFATGGASTGLEMDFSGLAIEESWELLLAYGVATMGGISGGMFEGVF